MWIFQCDLLCKQSNMIHSNHVHFLALSTFRSRTIPLKWPFLAKFYWFQCTLGVLQAFISLFFVTETQSTPIPISCFGKLYPFHRNNHFSIFEFAVTFELDSLCVAFKIESSCHHLEMFAHFLECNQSRIQ